MLTKIFFYKNFTTTSTLRFEITLFFTCFIKLFRTTIRFILANIFVINIQIQLTIFFFYKLKL